MLKLKFACTLLALIIALYSATAIVAVKINLAVALACITMVVALISLLMRTDDHGGNRGHKERMSDQRPMKNADEPEVRSQRSARRCVG
jgi:hypothetical protein